jgi:amidase
MSSRENDPIEEPEESGASVSRRDFLRLGAAAGAGVSIAAVGGAAPGMARRDPGPKLSALGTGPHRELEDATIAELQDQMARRNLSAEDLVDMYLARIEAIDTRPGLNSIIERNPDARRIARDRDEERRRGDVRGPLHGIPFVVKDNIDSADAMQTAAGSLALVGSPALQDATAIAKLRAAGAVLLGKANLSEWANFRGFESTSGWSGRGNQCNNPYVLDRNPCGSSSGSAAAVSFNLAAFALGTETDGSVVCPSSACGVVGIKPTVGLTSRAGVIPIAHTQDTVGPHGRTVADAAAVLGALVGEDPRDPATFASAGHFFNDYTQFLDPNGLAGARIGVARDAIFGTLTGESAEVFEEALRAMEDAGAVIVDPAPIPSAAEFGNDISEIVILVYEFKRDLNAYLATRTGVPVQTMADVIQFNLEHADQELLFFGQEWFELSQAEIFSEAEYQQALQTGPRLAGPEGIDAAMTALNLDALVAPTGSPSWPTDLINGDHFLFGSSSFAAVAGYPLVTVPAGFWFELPLGVTFMGGAFSEPTLIRLASGFEAATGNRRKPRGRPGIPGLGDPDANPVKPRSTYRPTPQTLRTAVSRFGWSAPRMLRYL